MISLDIIIDFNSKDEKKIFSEIKEEISEKYPDYNVYLVLDKDFSLSKNE